MKTQNSFYITERHNPQFKNPYYIPHGQLSKTKAKTKEDSSYGTNIVLEYITEESYRNAIEEFRMHGFHISGSMPIEI